MHPPAAALQALEKAQKLVQVASSPEGVAMALRLLQEQAGKLDVAATLASETKELHGAVSKLGKVRHYVPPSSKAAAACGRLCSWVLCPAVSLALPPSERSPAVLLPSLMLCPPVFPSIGSWGKALFWTSLCPALISTNPHPPTHLQVVLPGCQGQKYLPPATSAGRGPPLLH